MELEEYVENNPRNKIFSSDFFSVTINLLSKNAYSNDLFKSL